MERDKKQRDGEQEREREGGRQIVLRTAGGWSGLQPGRVGAWSWSTNTLASGCRAAWPASVRRAPRASRSEARAGPSAGKRVSRSGRETRVGLFPLLRGEPSPLESGSRLGVEPPNRPIPTSRTGRGRGRARRFRVLTSCLFTGSTRSGSLS